MLRLNTSYSKKIPVPGQEFSSQSYHASLEIELSDALEPGQIQARIRDTFEMVRTAVERELNGDAETVPAPRARSPQGGNGNRKAGGSGGNPASNKQIKYLNDLAAGQGIGVRQLNARLQDKYGVSSAYELSRKQASEIIDALQGKIDKAA